MKKSAISGPSPETLKEIDKLVRLRLEQAGMVLKAGQQPMTLLISELVLQEVKINSLLLFLEQEYEFDFSGWDEWVRLAIGNELAIEEEMKQKAGKPPSPILVK